MGWRVSDQGNSQQARHWIAVSGASGLIGRALCAWLAERGDRVIRLVRRDPGTPDEVQWDPARGVLEPQRLEGIDAIVHLAGENIAAGRWTAARMDAIRFSRVDATRALLTSLNGLQRPPATILCASAVGFYGDRGDEWLSEASPPGSGFLADVCQQWEAAAALGPAAARRAQLRFGVVLSPTGGALAQLLTPFRAGLGGPAGSGKQYMSWVALDDAIAAVGHVLEHARIVGPVNVVAPAPVTNRAFAQDLGHVLRRPAFLRTPAFILRAMFGQMADETILASARVEAVVLSRTGYDFRHRDLEGTLRHLLSGVGA